MFRFPFPRLGRAKLLLRASTVVNARKYKGDLLGDTECSQKERKANLQYAGTPLPHICHLA